MKYLMSIIVATLQRVVRVVVAHEKPYAEVVTQNLRFHELAQGTTEAHRHLDPFRHWFPHLVPLDLGGS